MNAIYFLLDNGNFRRFRMINLPEGILKSKIMEVKIKNGEEMIDATIEMVDGVMVVSPKVEKFEPKDGDVVTYFHDDKPTVYIYKSGHRYNTFFYAAYSSIREQCLLGTGGHLDMNRSDIRPATEEEKKLLFDKLKKEGLAWDAEKKEVVKIKWKPKFDTIYYKPQLNVSQFRVTSVRWFNLKEDEELYQKGWVFQTNEDCAVFVKKLNQAIEGVKP